MKRLCDVGIKNQEVRWISKDKASKGSYAEDL